MDVYSFPRNQYDLCRHRPRIMDLSSSKKPKRSANQKAITIRINAQREALDELSERLQGLLNKNRSFDFCITLAVNLLNQGWPESRQQQRKDFESEVCRQDTENEAEVIQSRIVDAAKRGRHLRTIFSRITRHIVQCPHSLPLSIGSDPIFFYRLQTSQSATTYDCGIGFICGKWCRKPSFKKPTKSQFRKHMNGIGLPSPYISLTESPARLYNFYRYKRLERSDADITLVDVRRLLQIGLKIARSTDMAADFGVTTSDTRYITRTHWLAQWLIPSQCIIKIISLEEFKNACRMHRILDS